MDNLRQDLVYALRRLVQAPGFTLVAVATLALGVGANSAIFSVIHAVLLKPLPFTEPDRLVELSQVWEGRATRVYSPQNFLDLQTQAQSFESMAAIDSNGVTLTGREEPARLDGAQVSASFFDVLGIHPALGRGFHADENEPDRGKVAILGHGLWQRRFGADPAIVGQTVRLDREPYLVVGVAPAGFSFPEGAEIWTPLEYNDLFRTKSRGAWYLTVIARLKPAVALQQARLEVDTIAGRLAKEYPDMDQGVGGTATSLQDALVGGSRPSLLLLLGAVGVVLLIACVNVANLLLARAATRETELAVRRALGAGRKRLLRQLVTESLLLAVMGGAVGVFLAWVSLDGLLSLQPAGIPRLAEVRIDPVVLGFATALSLITGLLFGAFPAFQMTRRAMAQTLREGGRGLLGGGGTRLRGGLVVGQIALAMVLLTGAGLLIRSFAQLRHVDPGFRSENALTFRISLPGSAYGDEPKQTAFFEELTTRLGALPGVRSVAGVTGMPLSGQRLNISFEIKGRPQLPAAQQPSMEMRVATVDYFKAMGIPVLKGRGFERGDTATSRQVVVLSEAAVRRHFPHEDPIGKWITLGWGRGTGLPKPGGEVVGIVGNVKEIGLAEEDLPEVYLPYPQLPLSSMDILLRTTVSPMSLAPSAASVVHGLDPEIPLARIGVLDDVVARSISAPRFNMLLLGAFSAMALLLSALGIFGAMSYAVVHRSREIGIRVALGAHPGSVLRMVMRDALVLATIGVAAGVAGSLALSRTMAGLLFNLSPTDPATLAGTAVVLSAVAILASYLPARQATRVDPLTALRSE